MKRENGKFAEGNQEGGAPEGNTNAEVHGYWTEDHRFIEHMSDEERELMFDMADELIERYEEVHGEKPNHFALESIKNLVLDVIKRRRFNEYAFSQDYIDFDNEERHRVYSRILNDYHKEMKELGLARDPESEKQRAESGWFAVQQDTEDDEDDEDDYNGEPRGYDPEEYEDTRSE